MTESRLIQTRVMLAKSSRFGIVFLLLFPAIQAIALLSRIWSWVPVWSWYPDPGYQYIVNGAVIIRGGVPGHTDHPGTSLQWLAGFVEVITHVFSNRDLGLFDDIVTHTETYAVTISLSLLVIYLASLVFATIQLHRYLGFWPTLAFQLFMLWGFSLLSEGIFKIVPESVVLSAFLILVALLSPELTKPRAKLTLLVVLAIGVVCAIGLTSKVIFLPALVLLPFLMRFKQFLLAMGMMLVSAALIMIPTYSRFSIMVDWYSKVATRTARHGQMSDWDVSTSFSTSISGIEGQLRWFVPVFLLLALLFGLAVFGSLTTNARGSRSFLTLLGLGATLAATVLIGYKQAEPRDFVLLVPILALITAVCICVNRESLPSRFFNPITTAVIILGVFLAAHGLVGSTYNWRTTVAISDSRIYEASLIEQYAQSSAVAIGYDVWTPASALAFAEEWTLGQFGPSVARNYPDHLEYSIWDGSFHARSPELGTYELTCSQLKDIQLRDNLTVVVRSSGHVPLSADKSSFPVKGAVLTVGESLPLGNDVAFPISDVTCNIGG